MADLLGLGPACNRTGRRFGFDESAERGRINRRRAQGQNAGGQQFPRRFQGETLAVRMENTDTELFIDLDTPSDG